MNYKKYEELSILSSAILLKETMPYKTYVQKPYKHEILARPLKGQELYLCQKWCRNQLNRSSFKQSTAVLSIVKTIKV